MLCFTSCVSTPRVASSNAFAKNTNVKNVVVQLIHSNSADNGMIDSSVQEAINMYNKKSKALNISLYDGSSSENLITINFSDAKLVSDGGLTAGYIISAIGLIALPIYTYQASGHTGIWFLAYDPHDRLNFKAKYTNWHTKKHLPSRTFRVRSEALFSNKGQRRKRLSMQIQVSVFKLFKIIAKRTA